MIVVIDTNVVLTMFKPAHANRPVFDAWAANRLRWAVSTDILLEYEEVMTRLNSATYAGLAFQTMNAIESVRRNLIRVSPSFRFRLITADVDDDKFADCAIAAEADWIITEDHHFDALIGSGHKPQPITPEEFIARFLRGA